MSNLRILKHTSCTKIALLAATGSLAVGSLDAGVVYSLTNYTQNTLDNGLCCRLNGTTVEGTDFSGVSTLWGNSCDFVFSYSAGHGFSAISGQTASNNFMIGNTPLSAGATISASDYTDWTSGQNGLLLESGTYYIAFSEAHQGANADTTYYGYLEMNYVKDTSLTLIGGAIENTGAAIVATDVASAVPEPSATAGVIGSLAGAAALGAAWKRRKSLA
jgi:hypothetical protein